MSDYRIYIYKESQLKSRAGNGMRREAAYGCDGSLHAAWLEKVLYNESGEVLHADHVGTILKGSCDKSCKGASQNLGGFLYP